MRNHYAAVVLLSSALFACGNVNLPNGPADAPTDGGSTFILTVMKNGNGTGIVASGPAGISCGGGCSAAYASGTSVTLTATADAGTTFVGWAGGGCSGTAVCTIAISADVTITASFALNDTLLVARAGNGNGTVMSNPVGINCGTDCSEIYAPNTTVVLIASAAAGSVFSGWSGGGCSGTGTCSVSIIAATMVTAMFTLNTYTLSVAMNGTGQGTVTSSPAGINCGSDCVEPYNYNTPVVLTATPNAGSTFAGWSGGGCSGTGACSVMVTMATTVTATFTLNSYTLTVIVNALNGAVGIVTSDLAGINCGTDCTEPYKYGTTVTLTASTPLGDVFLGWSGGGCSGTGTCKVTITADTSVSALFTLGAVQGQSILRNIRASVPVRRERERH